MTVEEFINQELARHSKAVEDKYAAKIEALKSKFETTKAALWQTHREVVAGSLKENVDMNMESLALNDAKNAKKKPAAGKKAVKEKKMVCGRHYNPTLPLVRVKCISAREENFTHYLGQEWALQPAYDKPCKIGRSKHQHYTGRGMSLSIDAEVSTSHGEIGISKKTQKLYYKDVGSSNGTAVLVDGKEADVSPGIELELVSGTVFRIGVCLYEVTID